MGNDRAFRFGLIFVGALALFILIYDLSQVVRGTVDLNRHVPFLLPAVLAAFVAMGAVALRVTSSSNDNIE